MSERMITNVLIVEKNDWIRASMRAILEGELDMDVIGATSDPMLALVGSRQLKPDAIVLGFGVSGADGIKMVPRALRAFPGAKVLACSVYSDSQLALRTLYRGAHGYILKDRCHKDLAGAIRTVLRNRIYLSPGIAGVVREETGDCSLTQEGKA
jgi:DNA-binding NarL/FixJ family response regulator